jgi:hypothetical protein
MKPGTVRISTRMITYLVLFAAGSFFSVGYLYGWAFGGKGPNTSVYVAVAVATFGFLKILAVLRLKRCPACAREDETGTSERDAAHDGLQPGGEHLVCDYRWKRE